MITHTQTALPSSTAAWSEQFQKLKEYFLIHGHCNVPYTCPTTSTITIEGINDNDDDDVDSINKDYASLHTWCKHQRRHYKHYYELGQDKSTLTPDQVEQLESVGFGYNVTINNKKDGQQLQH